MSNMSYMEKLLDGVEVEWKPIGKVIQYEQPTKYLVQTKKYNNIFSTPVLTAGKTFILGYTEEKDGIYKALNSPVIIFDDFTTANKWVDFDFKAKSSAMKMITSVDESIILLRYFYHWLNTLSNELIAGDHKRQWISNFSKKYIPVPPLKVQNEIVRILDTFTELTTELTTELNSRKKQYTYYRDQLLTFNDGEVEWKSLGEVGKFTYGLAAKAQTSGNARFVRISDINSNGKLLKTNAKFVDITKENEKYLVKKNDLLMARTGATYGKTMIFDEEYTAIYAGFLIKLDLDKDLINPKFYWHFAQSDLFWNQANKLVSGGGQPQFNGNALKQVKLPIPSLKTQEKIVSILDKFDTLTSSISEGLPREIELRNKQYEYYRDLLLNFPKTEVEV